MPRQINHSSKNQMPRRLSSILSFKNVLPATNKLKWFSCCSKWQMDKRADSLKQLQVFGTPSAYFQCNSIQCFSLSLLLSIKNQLCRIKCVWRERKMGMKHCSNAFIFEWTVLMSMSGIWYYKIIFVMFYSFSVLNVQLASNMSCALSAQQRRPTLAGLIKHAAL